MHVGIYTNMKYSMRTDIADIHVIYVGRVSLAYVVESMDGKKSYV
jgi:hypothetical protein